jgi:hypothetical protein
MDLKADVKPIHSLRYLASPLVALFNIICLHFYPRYQSNSHI